jgi:Ca2+-binding EF-hand superfamily protein
VHVVNDGKAVLTAWDGFMKSLFEYLDTDRDGVLSRPEAERVPPSEMLFGSFAIRGRLPAPETPFNRLDADRDGKVSLDEVKAFYRREGGAPLQVQFGPAQQAGPRVIFDGRVAPEAPSADALNDALFARLDADRDGKLSRQELAAVPSALLPLDADENETVSVQEIMPVTNPPVAAGGDVLRLRPPQAADGGPVVLVTPGDPGGVVNRLLARYGPRGGRPEDKKLSRAEIGLDEAAFDRLDRDRDGRLDAQELAGFVALPPDLELTARVGRKEPKEPPLELMAGPRPSPLAGQTRKLSDAVVALDLGKTRVDFQTGVPEQDQFRVANNLVREQYVGQFKQADADNNGYLDRNEAERHPIYRGVFRLMDRDGDGMLYEKEVAAYVDKFQELQGQAQACTATLVFSDKGRGLFDLLDPNRDGRLSVREMRQAPKLLNQLDPSGTGQFGRGDVPRNHQLAVRRGPAGGGGLPGGVVVVRADGRAPAPAPEATAGPLWFRKMDRNRDGDVSGREFLGSDEDFRRIDADADGLISVEEAERYDTRTRGQRTGRQ